MMKAFILNWDGKIVAGDKEIEYIQNLFESVLKEETQEKNDLKVLFWDLQAISLVIQGKHDEVLEYPLFL